MHRIIHITNNLIESCQTNERTGMQLAEMCVLSKADMAKAMIGQLCCEIAHGENEINQEENIYEIFK